ncbi:MAG: DNRLRE domain-containing protein [Syntrophomonadaceae bacterium]|nr:DNRLRE domain-containing protein [Syntrophomonadaceae bacterium]
MATITLLPKMNVYIAEWYPDANFGDHDSLYVSRYLQEGDRYRSVLFFDLKSVPAASTIVKAELLLYLYHNEVENCIEVTAHRLLNNWCQCEVTWNNCPAFDNHVDGQMIIQEQTSLCKVKMDITCLANGWYDGSIPNNGLILIGNEAVNSLDAFRSKNWPNSSTWPHLRIEYINGVMDIYECEELKVPRFGCPVIESRAIPLGPRKMITFLVQNDSSEAVETKLQLGNCCDPDVVFFDDGPWIKLCHKNSTEEAAALTSQGAAEFARVLVKGQGGETVKIFPRTKE